MSAFCGQCGVVASPGQRFCTGCGAPLTHVPHVAPPGTASVAPASLAGRSCPYCRFPLKEGSPVGQCAVCGAVHHEDCYRDNGGCAVVGCSGGPSLRPSTSGAAPNVAMPGIAPAPPDTRPPQKPGMASATPVRQPLRRGLVIAGIVAIIAGGVIGAVVAIGGKSSPKARVVSRDSVRRGVTPTATAATSVNVSQEQGAVVAVLRSYERVASDHNLDLLGSVLLPSVSRRGAAYGSSQCTDSHGKNAVLAVYQDQFTRTTGQYQLVDLSPSAVVVNGETATATLHYLWVSDGATGSVTFTLAKAPAGWAISRISAICS